MPADGAPGLRAPRRLRRAHGIVDQGALRENGRKDEVFVDRAPARARKERSAARCSHSAMAGRVRFAGRASQ